MTLVRKVPPAVVPRLKGFLRRTGYSFEDRPHQEFMARAGGCVVSVYTSGKVVVQGGDDLRIREVEAFLDRELDQHRVEPPKRGAGRGRTGGGAQRQPTSKDAPSDPSITRAWVDGGSRGNPGPAAWGVKFEDGTELRGYLGRTTNNVAEYHAAIEAMEHALDQGIERLHLIGDSKLVEGQLTKGWKVNKNTELVERAKALTKRFRTFRYQAVPRERNREADSLVNRELDERASGGS